LENVSHDVVSNFLKRNRITAQEVWISLKVKAKAFKTTLYQHGKICFTAT